MAGTAIEIRVGFRLCREDDLEALEWMGLHTRERDVIAEAFAAQQRGEALMLLAVASDFPVGQAWIDFETRGSAACPHLWAVRVFPPLQGAGLGKKLIEKAEILARRRGARLLELSVEWDNIGARQFYRRLGYRPVRRRRHVVHHGSAGPEIETGVRQLIMRKRIKHAVPGPRVKGRGRTPGSGRLPS